MTFRKQVPQVLGTSAITAKDQDNQVVVQDIEGQTPERVSKDYEDRTLSSCQIEDRLQKAFLWMVLVSFGLFSSAQEHNDEYQRLHFPKSLLKLLSNLSKRLHRTKLRSSGQQQVENMVEDLAMELEAVH